MLVQIKKPIKPQKTRRVGLFKKTWVFLNPGHGVANKQFVEKLNNLLTQ